MWGLEYTGVTGLALGIGMDRVLCTTWMQSLLWHVHHFNKQGRKTRPWEQRQSDFLMAMQQVEDSGGEGSQASWLAAPGCCTPPARLPG